MVARRQTAPTSKVIVEAKRKVHIASLWNWSVYRCWSEQIMLAKM